jgi:hypothetical protein
MRRRRLAVIGAVILIGCGIYAGLWWYAAGRIKEAVATQLPDRARGAGVDAAWQSVRVAGFPFAFRIELAGVTLHRAGKGPEATIEAAALSASTHPWDFRVWELAAPGGIAATFGPAGPGLARLSAAAASGAVAVAGDGAVTVWLTLNQAKGAALGGEIAAHAADAWVIVPAQAAQTHTDTGFGVAAVLHDLALPDAPPGLGRTIADIGVGLTLRGKLVSGPLREAAAAWRDSGGTLELDQFRLHWGELGVTASGTLALDGELQPVGGFSGAVAGYDQLMSTLVAAGRVKASDARMARLALAILAKAGPDGRPEISTSFTLQNGEMFLGPAKLGKAPRIDW